MLRREGDTTTQQHLELDLTVLPLEGETRFGFPWQLFVESLKHGQVRAMAKTL